MEYINKKTGVIINVTSVIHSELYEPVEKKAENHPQPTGKQPRTANKKAVKA